MKDAVIIDFGTYQKQNVSLVEPEENTGSLISEELIHAIQLLIQQLRNSSPLKHST
jgi:hypothetical protein